MYSALYLQQAALNKTLWRLFTRPHEGFPGLSGPATIRWLLLMALSVSCTFCTFWIALAELFPCIFSPVSQTQNVQEWSVNADVACEEQPASAVSKHKQNFVTNWMTDDLQMAVTLGLKATTLHVTTQSLQSQIAHNSIWALWAFVFMVIHYCIMFYALWWLAARQVLR